MNYECSGPLLLLSTHYLVMFMEFHNNTWSTTIAAVFVELLFACTKLPPFLWSPQSYTHTIMYTQSYLYLNIKLIDNDKSIIFVKNKYSKNCKLISMDEWMTVRISDDEIWT